MNKPLNPHLRQANVIASAFCPQDLRIGNVLNYDTEEEGIELTVIDWQDLKWLSENPESFNKKHSPMPLTEENLIKLGFEKVGYGRIRDLEFVGFGLNDWNVYVIENGDFELHKSNIGEEKFIVKIEYAHQLQNLFYCLTGQELFLR
jgi:hypothetical protein